MEIKKILTQSNIVKVLLILLFLFIIEKIFIKNEVLEVIILGVSNIFGMIFIIILFNENDNRVNE